MKTIKRKPRLKRSQAQGPYADLALHTIGWKAFQDMAAQICEERLSTSVTIHHEAKDGGQDAIFLIPGSRKKAPPRGTVQVKHSSDPRGSLTLSDLTQELKKLEELVAEGEADSYIVVTNMSVSAPNAKVIRNKLRKLGVNKPDVWGKQQITLTIKESSKLRALVPQVYGLGDLSTILDARAIEQTKAILKAWLPKLKAYVPTTSHDRAVRVLDKHKVVLLLGNPASGKSTIGAILSTMAVEEEDHSVIQISSPEEFVEHWNPDFKNRFFWIDDAFGSNVVDTDHIQGWARAFPKVSAAINGGNRFLFTSRNYIYLSAANKLGSRNLSLFKSDAAVVNVGALSISEKRQILYNHIKHGQQTETWKRKAKEHLEAVANVEGFLPGISERLGNPDLTKQLALTEDDLCGFMSNPQEHLIEVINELEPEQFAALALIYVHRNRLVFSDLDEDAVKAIEETTGHGAQAVLPRLPELAGSFTRDMSEASEQVWGFEHPTIADAITGILDARPNMTSAIVRGGPIEKVMSQFVCEDGADTQNAPKIPTSLEGVLNKRLLEVPNHWRTNGLLFEFLASRASDDVVLYQFENHDGLMDRNVVTLSRASYSAKNRAAARAFALGALDDLQREQLSREFVAGAIDYFDLSWVEEDGLLALVEPRALLSLGALLSSRVVNDFDDLLGDKRSDIDIDADIEDQYDVISSGLQTLDTLLEEGAGGDVKAVLAEAGDRLRAEISDVLQEQEEHWAGQEESGDWDIFSENQSPSPTRKQRKDDESRSVFEDVDTK
ncbi:restriction endonuclease [Cognatiyoonia sp. IB215182]|uniref:nSTAND3 domain-containing NTPase n=1 Tax=Cognatiyoonia sp. IB215182 TaxID=3097353 RepID=UPI002A109EC6|nr:restriction endonuclease [Cognatiyoonia sp. IB215182]MDX8354840.1 restriction endonuclease [Cognatiyoonia sp. IB215182]